jgi:homocitrate synthase NifV
VITEAVTEAVTKEENILLCDTTLRDGEQTPGIALGFPEKELIARALADAGIDELEVGVPAVGPDEAASIKHLVSLHLPVRLITWNRAVSSDLEASFRTGVEGVAISIPVSDQQIVHKLKESRSWVIDKMGEAVVQAKKEVNYICLGLEDSSRADKDFLLQVCLEAEKLGVNRVRLADTLGIMNPMEVHNRFSSFPDLLNIPLEFHAHNDLGMATANAITAIQTGFRAVSTTVGGLGERAGNACLEEIVIALKYGLNQNIRFDHYRLSAICLVVSLATHRKIQRNKPIVGSDVFAHTSSLHLDGIYKDIANYEAFPPESVSRKHSSALGKYSGRKAVIRLLESKGITITNQEMKELLVKIRQQSTILKRPLQEQDILELVSFAPGTLVTK